MRIPAPVLTVLLVLGTLTASPLVTRAARGNGSTVTQQPAATPAQQPAATPDQQPAAPPPDQPAAGGQQPPRIRTGISYVRVDVIVTDKSGKQVLDLTPEDFSLSEDGKPQKIESFDVVKIDGTSNEIASGPPHAIKDDTDEEREAVRPDVRLFVILLDDYHVRRGNDMSVRKPLIDFIENQLAPADMIAIMYPLTPVTDLRFNRDRAGAVTAINNFLGRKFDYVPRNSFEEQYANYPSSVVERIRNQVTMGALKGAAVRMAGLREGRKSIIFVSEGFTAMLPTQLQDPNASLPGLGNPYRGDSGAPQADMRQNMTAKMDLLSDMEQVFATLNRQNTSIYAVDPRGLAAFEYDVNEAVGIQQDAVGLRASLDTLHELASNTDGRAIVDRNDLAAGMKQIMRDSSGYYLLGYNSTQAPTDGKFHAIKVNVRRKGVDVRARKGYWAYTVEDAARATAPAAATEAPSAVTNALGDLAAPSRDRSARFWVGTARGENGKTRLTFLWEPATPVPGQRAEEPASRVALTAISPDGRPVFRGRVPDEAPDASAPSSSGPTASGSSAVPPGSTASVRPGGVASFDVPPGRLELKMVVEGSHGQVIDSAGRELTIPDYNTVQVSFGTPRVYRARTLPELQSIRSKPDAPPTAEREFSRSDRLFIRIDAYAAGGVTPALNARLLNRGGKAMSDLPVQAPPGRPAEIDLPLSALAAGEYVVELNAKSPSGTAQELIAFKVGR
jgi:VWFA-related protein